MRDFKMPSDTTDLGHVSQLALEVFGSKKAANDWFQKPALAMSNRIPKDLLANSSGRQQIETALRRFKYCVYT